MRLGDVAGRTLEGMRRVWGALRRRRLDSDLQRELEAHLEIAEEELLRRGHGPGEAKRLARIGHGKLTQALESMRDQRGLPALDSFALDVRLGLRMLRKSWGLTLVGGFAMTVVICVGAVVFDFLHQVAGGSMPLEEGDRVIAIQTWDRHEYARRETAAVDFRRWRDSLRSVDDVGAFVTLFRNLTREEAPPELVSIAEMSAAGFRLARTPPMLGRLFTEEDERNGAVPVVIIGEEIWRSHFDLDADILGRQIRLGRTPHTVVGVMPAGFGFPMNHRFWTPLASAIDVPLATTGGRGAIFGRLAPGSTMNSAQAELDALGLMAGDEISDESMHLEPRIVPYAYALTGEASPLLARLILIIVVALLVPPCVNVAILVYARTVTRQQELATRCALGATRERVVGQLFVEVLLLSAAAGAVALGIARFVMGQAEALLDRQLAQVVPFWMSFDLSLRQVVFVAALSALAATIAGLAPALQATRRLAQGAPRALGSATSFGLGTTWTVLIVLQVALSVSALPSAVEVAWGALRPGVLGPGFAAEEYLAARLTMDSSLSRASTTGAGQPPAHFPSLRREVVRQLRSEPSFLGAATASAAPGEEPWAVVELEPMEAASEPGARLRLSSFALVDDDYFDLFGFRLLAGRAFGRADFDPGRSLVVVNQTFVHRFMDDESPLGRRVRYRRSLSGETPLGSDPERWYEIVGVVADLPANRSNARIYHPADPDLLYPASLALRLRGRDSELPGRLREIAAALDPALMVDDVAVLSDTYRRQAIGNNYAVLALVATMLAVLLLSAAGIYALISFTVSQRRREIGIRTALGAPPSRVLSGVLGRAAGQLLVGAALGLLAATLLQYYLPVVDDGGWNVPFVLPAAALLMATVGLLSALGPARRALRVEPTEALRES